MKNRIFFMGVAVGLVALLAGMTGCGPKKPDGFPEIYPTTVKIIQAGAPLAGASVTFIAQNVDKTWVVSGTTNDSGVATLLTEAYFKGAPAGKYVVTVTKVSSDWSHAAKSNEEYDAMQERGEESTFTTTFSVEPKFADPNQSGLEAEVGTGTNDFTFDVGDKFENIIEENYKPLG